MASAGASSASSSPSPSPTPPPGPVDTRRFFTDLRAQVDAQDSVRVALESPYESIFAELQPSTNSARITLHDPDQWLNVVIIGKRYWTNDEEKSGAPWIPVAQPPGAVQEALPAYQFEQWRSGARSVTRGQTETVEGHQITSYSIVVKAEQAYQVLGLQPPTSGPPTVTVLLRLDERGLPTRATAAVEDGSLDIEYIDWGAPIEVVAPPVG
ncbi:hypothetical protein [Phycicoccus avicenniae]|uniref:hypothetical protein n=1 Tax=Phycicoccus avicenniae TaxID=2828860 RepID=UPI003D2A0DDF